MSHTKTPWKIRDGGEVGTDKEMTAAIFPVTGEENKANAAFIVKAVNNHYLLIKEVKNLHRLLSYADYTQEIDEAIIKAVAAIKEAE